jgi:DNA polymerase beta
MNSLLINNLRILEKYYIKNKDYFRQLAYEKAIKTLSKLDFIIRDEKQVKKLTGIGPGIFKKIKEFIQTGKITKVEEVRSLIETKDEKEKVINSFLNIWGVGDVKANNLWDLGYRSIEDIKKNSEVLNRSQLIGLKYYDDLLQRIPRKSMKIYHAIIIFILNKKFGKDNYKLEVAGSYRRGSDSSGDMDVLITSNVINLSQIVNILVEWKFITDILSLRNEKFMGIAKCPNTTDQHFRLDIEFVPESQFPFALLYFTGSKDFNKEIRLHAKKLGYKLNEHSLENLKTHEFINANTEEDIFYKLNVKYLNPKDRN